MMMMMMMFYCSFERERERERESEREREMSPSTECAFIDPNTFSGYLLECLSGIYLPRQVMIRSLLISMSGSR